MYCQNCGSKIDDDAKYCPICGNVLELQGNYYLPPQQPENLNIQPQQGFNNQQPPQSANQSVNQGGYQQPPQGANQSVNQGGYQQPPQGANQGVNQGGYQQPPQGANQGGNPGGYQQNFNNQQPPQGNYQQPQPGYQQGYQGGYQPGPQGPQGPQGYQSPQQPPQRKKRGKKGLVIGLMVGLVVLLAAVGGGLFFWLRGDSFAGKDVAEENQEDDSEREERKKKKKEKEEKEKEEEEKEKDKEDEEKEDEEKEDVQPVTATGNFSDGGQVLNIAVWNEEFINYMTDFYPGYERVDSTTGKIGDVTVNWIIEEAFENGYQSALDLFLLGQDSASPDNKLDLFLVEPDYAMKYADTDFTVSISDLGITYDDMVYQYTYTQEVVRDSNGNIKGLTWMCCPGAMIYNREIAKEVFGTDDPETIQTMFGSWSDFKDSADKLKKAGYSVIASPEDTFRAYEANRYEPWVNGNKIVIDANLEAWVYDSKELVDSGSCGTNGTWSEEWAKGFYPEGKVFCYFGPQWFSQFTMAADISGSVANSGGWAVTEGPHGFNWGGSWICVAAGTDNATLAADILKTMTCDYDVMSRMQEEGLFVNNFLVSALCAEESDYNESILGGQNPIEVYEANAFDIMIPDQTPYDTELSTVYRTVMMDYMRGNYATYDIALDAFYEQAIMRFPELTR